MDFEIIGLSELIAKLEPNDLMAEPLRDFFAKSTATVAHNVAALTPVDKGYLRASINAGVEIDDNPIPLWGRVGTNRQQLAIWMEYGTRPHDIYPRNKLALHFEMGGKEVFAKHVHHPGTRPYAMFEQGLANSLADIETYAEEAGKQIEEIFGK